MGRSTRPQLSLVRLGHALARANASEQTIIDALAERDETLGWCKFTDRDDADRYAEIAAAAIRALVDDDMLSGARDDWESSVPSLSVLVGTELVDRNLTEFQVPTVPKTPWN